MKRSEILSNITYIIEDNSELTPFEIAQEIIELQEELDVVKEWEKE